MKRAHEETTVEVATNSKENTAECISDNTRLGICEVCAAKEARYSCPKCEVKTCSLPCVQIHKKELDCDGIRDRTKFIPLRKMTKMDFMSDYYFLEECTRFTEDRKDDNIKRFTRINKELPVHLYRLRQAAAQRGTKLNFLLQNFSRHKENSTFYDWKQRKIYWRIEWIFVNAGNLQYVDERCSEDDTLISLLDKYVNPKCTEIVQQKSVLEYYQSAGAFNLKVLLKAEGIKCSRTRFHALDVSKTLKENLKGKILVEFPCIYVSYETQSAGFDVIDSDEDVETETKTYQTSLNEFYKQQCEAAIKAAIAAASDDDDEDIDTTINDTNSSVGKNTKHEKETRRQKRENYEKTQNNYLFTDENLWDVLSSSSDTVSDNETSKC